MEKQFQKSYKKKITKQQPDSNRSSSPTLKITPLGGQEEVGRNMSVFEYGQDIVIVDMGIQFPEEDMPGIDYIIPNTSYLKNKTKNIKAVVFTHGHLDHIGAAPILLEKLGNPLIIGTKLTLALIKRRVEEHKKGSYKNIKTLEISSISETIKFGDIQLNFFDVEHSIMDSVGVIIKTPAGTVIHTGDWTIDVGDPEEKGPSYEHLSLLPKPIILMMESLGALSKKPLVTEKQMLKNLENIITQAPGRVIIGTFSTQVKRIRDILSFAEKLGKKVAFDGFSMKTNVKVAQELGYIKTKPGTIIDIKNVNQVPKNKAIVLCTGAQGESRAVLSRIISGNHRYINIEKDDTVVFSSSIIPGNERSIQRLKDDIYRQCDNVIHNEIMDVHVSGHNNRLAIKKLVKQIKPNYLLPIYANYYLLKECKNLVAKDGFPEKNIFILDNGQSICFNKNTNPVLSKKKADTSYVFIDGLGTSDLQDIVLRDRRALANDGIFVIIAAVNNKTGKIINSPDIISRGFVYLKESKTLLSQTRKKTIAIINQTAGPEKRNNWLYVKNSLRNQLGDFLYSKTKKRPMILPVIIEV